MIRNIIILILCLTELSLNAQAKLALVNPSSDFLFKNGATIYTALMQVRDNEWYKKNIQPIINSNNVNVRRDLLYNSTLEIYFDGTVKAIFNEKVPQEIQKAYIDIAKYIEDNHCIIYRYWHNGQSNHCLFYENKKKDKNKMMKLLMDYININIDSSDIIIDEHLTYKCKFFTIPIFNDVALRIKYDKRNMTPYEILTESCNFLSSKPINSSLNYGITNNDLNIISDTAIKQYLNRLPSQKIKSFLYLFPCILDGELTDPVVYDESGRVVEDASRGITSITYNPLNLPKKIQLGSNDAIYMTYRADGVKVSEKTEHRYAKIVERVNSDGDTVYTERGMLELVNREYYGSMVKETGRPTRIYNEMGYIDIHRSDSIEFCYFERDYLGSIRAVTDADGRLLQSVDYHDSGNLVVNVVSDRQATNRLHTSKEFQPFQGVALYDNQARYYDPIGSKFLTMDPLCEKYPNLSPYSHCANNPLSIIDPDGRDTINISYQNNKWNIESPIIAEGDDLFNVSINGEISTFTFSDSEYGNRVNMLNLEVGEEFNDITFGVYHISGAAQDGTGYYIAPGGNADNTYGSKKRIIDGAYPILKPHENAQWQKPGVGGSVSSRGIRFHYGINRKWTNGCFILSYDYNVGNYNIFDLNSSILASRNFDMFLGASSKFIHKTTTEKKREGSIFNNIIKHKLILKTR